MQDVSEAEFHQQVDHVQDLIEHAVDACDLDLEMEHMEGSLVLEKSLRNEMAEAQVCPSE